MGNNIQKLLIDELLTYTLSYLVMKERIQRITDNPKYLRFVIDIDSHNSNIRCMF